MKNKIKNWLTNLIHHSDEDVSVDIAKVNYQKHQKDLEIIRNNYIKYLCREIKTKSRLGYKFIDTETLLKGFMTYEFMMELKEYFEQRGFDVKEERNHYGVLTSWLRISWQ